MTTTHRLEWVRGDDHRHFLFVDDEETARGAVMFSYGFVERPDTWRIWVRGEDRVSSYSDDLRRAKEEAEERVREQLVAR